MAKVPLERELEERDKRQRKKRKKKKVLAFFFSKFRDKIVFYDEIGKF